MIVYLDIVIALWNMVAIYWIFMAFKNKSVTKSERSFSRTLYLIVMLASFYLLFSRNFIIDFGLNSPFYENSFLYYVGFIVSVLGLFFAVYARYFLGKDWSGRVEIKKDHRLITTGPYALTRNPIYTGLLFGILGTALMCNQVKGLVALVLIFTMLSLKIKKEEEFLINNFSDYDNYKQRVKKLIPFIY